MSQDQLSDQTEAALKAVLMLIGDNKRQGELRNAELAPQLLERLKLPSGAMGPLLDIVNRLDLLQGSRSETSTDKQTGKSSSVQVEPILLESFSHIRWSFWISATMSVVLFVFGIVFLGIALVQSLGADDVSTSTLTIAGLGVSDLVLLFYSRPWKDVATNLANSQQIRMIAISYLAGFKLVGTPETAKALADLTDHSVRLIQDLVEDRRSQEELNP